MADSLQGDNGPVVEKRRKAHRAANRLIVGAGIILAEAGIPRHAPEMKALSAALKAVNRADAGPWSQPVSPEEKETILAHTPSEAQRFRRAAP
jgi:hypothetical protein